MYIWKQWKKPKTKVANLRKLGTLLRRLTSRKFWIGILAYCQKLGVKLFHYKQRLAAPGYFRILNYYESLYSCG